MELDQIRIDGDTQPRVAIDEQVVAEYAELYSTGVDLPPVTVFFDGAGYWLADGFHRYWANKRISCDYVFADVHPGTQRDAILHSVGANAAHGLRRTNADKRKAVLTLLKDKEWSEWSDNDIAKRCGVDHKTVSSYRASLGNFPSEDPPAGPSNRTYKTKHGTIATMNTAKIGRKRRSARPRHGGISPDAMKPTRGHSVHQSKTALELPHDPQWACRTIVSAMGHDFARALVKELTTYLEGATE